MRALAHIEEITEILPIPNSSNIELVKLLLWQCVVKKAENFKVGDKVIYIEIDSIVPEKPEFEFLRNRKFRVRSIRLMKTLSQGLVLPLSYLPKANYKVGEDVSEIMNIAHYDPESNLNITEPKKENNKFLKFLLKFSLCRKIILPFMRKVKASWPEWVFKTDETRCQNLPKIFSEYKDLKFDVTEKLDGQSVTFFTKKVKSIIGNKMMFGVCSRNLWLKTPHNCNWWEMAYKYDIEKKLLKTKKELIVQGEIVGPTIQKNKYELSERKLFIFNVQEIIDGKTINYNSLEIQEFCMNNHIDMVPLLSTFYTLPTNIDDMLIYAKGKSVLNKKTIREGVVLRNYQDGKKISFKVINNDFLLKNEE